jgi:hypothetical protein
MAQIRGTAGYHLGNQSPFGHAGRTDDTSNDPSPLDQLRAQTNKIEDFLDTMSEPIKPYVSPESRGASAPPWCHNTHYAASKLIHPSTAISPQSVAS